MKDETIHGVAEMFFVAVLFVIIGAVAISMMVSKNSFDVECDIQGIQYIDVAEKGAVCYGNFNSHYCPMPARINCHVNGAVNSNTVQVFPKLLEEIA